MGTVVTVACAEVSSVGLCQDTSATLQYASAAVQDSRYHVAAEMFDVSQIVVADVARACSATEAGISQQCSHFAELSCCS